MLRRHLQKLKTELDTNIQYTALSAKSKKTIESREIVERRAAFLEDVLMEKCYVAFGGLVADNQYAALGLMLVGTLARVRRVVRPLRGKERDEEGSEGRMEGLVVKGGQDAQDIGEVVRREELVEGQGPDTADLEEEDNSALKRPKAKKRSVTAEEAKVSTVEDSIPSKRPKKKRKKGDALDDLFAGLV